jgi:hypothetical protein
MLDPDCHLLSRESGSSLRSTLPKTCELCQKVPQKTKELPRPKVGRQQLSLGFSAREFCSRFQPVRLLVSAAK